MRKRSLKEYLELVLLITVICAIASSLYNFYVNNPKKETGSFEYVRRGEELLNAGRFPESIKYFEKAYSASPENISIKAALANAYYEYGDFLAASQEFSKAIDCLKRACNIRRSTRAIQSLAIMYSKKAVYEAARDPAEAKSDLEAARTTAAESAIASRNLSVSLFNDALAAGKAENDGLAIMLLKQSSLVYKDASTFELLGDIYYRKADFERARFYYGKALSLDRQAGNAREKFRKALKELRLAGREESMRLAHFELRYDKSLPVDAGSLRDTLDKCYLDVGNDLKYFPDSRTVVFFYSQDDFGSIFKMPSSARAFYDGSIRIPLPGRRMAASELSGHLYHEYTHAVVSAKTGNNCPVWLSEGLAVWEEYRNREAEISRIIRNTIEEKQISLAYLYSPFDLRDEGKNTLVSQYLLAYSVVKFIADGWGLDGLRNLLVRLKNGQHVVNALDDELLLSEKEFEKRWKLYVLKKYLS